MKNKKISWFDLICGIIMILLGIFALINPDRLLTDIIRLYSIVAIVTSIRNIIKYSQLDHIIGINPTISLIGEVCSLMVGIMLFLYPNSGRLILTLLIPIWFISRSIAQLSRFGMERPFMSNTKYYISLALSILCLILGIVMLMDPILTTALSSSIVGIYLIVTGVNLIVTSRK